MPAAANSPWPFFSTKLINGRPDMGNSPKNLSKRPSFSCCSKAAQNDVIHHNTRSALHSPPVDYAQALSSAEFALFSPYHKVSDCSHGLPHTPECHHCGQKFTKVHTLDHHYAIHHAVSELRIGDSSRNIVEIIFKTSWVNHDSSFGRIQRVLKVHNPPTTIARFEEYRDAVKAKVNLQASLIKKHARCMVDGNELLRFYCTTISCALAGSSSPPMLCTLASCKLCHILRFGFQTKNQLGIYTTASSGKAHESAIALSSVQEGVASEDTHNRAMLVCRVIAGRVKKLFHEEDSPEASPASINGFDSVAGEGGPHESNVEDLLVFNPKALLPCFIVIYTTS